MKTSNLPLTFQKARLQLLKTFRYLATQVYSINPIFLESGKMPDLMSMDKNWNLYINKPAFEALTEKQRLSILYSFIHRILRKHATRGKRYPKPKLWDLACTMVVSRSTKLEVGESLYEDVVNQIPIQLDKDSIEESLYLELEKLPGQDNSGNGASGGSGNEDSGDSSSGLPDPKSGGISNNPQPWETQPPPQNQTKQELSESIQDSIVKTTLAKAAGSKLGELQRLAQQTLKPEPIKWQQLLRSKFLREYSNKRGCGDPSWKRVKQRLDNILFPRRLQRKIKVTAILDTSGSISSQELGEAYGHLTDIIKKCPGTELKVVCCDTKTYGTKIIRDVKEIKAVGGGGTDMMAGIDTVLKDKPKPKIIVVFTDGCCHWYSDFNPQGATVIIVLIGRFATKELPLPWATVLKSQP